MVKKQVMLSFRCTELEANRVRHLAAMYADGDLSTWLRWASLHADRKYLKVKRPGRHKRPSRLVP